MRILVTGSAGFIGSNTVDKLISTGNDVIALDNQSAQSNSEFYWNDRADNYFGDVRDDALVRGIFDKHRPDAVLHLAAISRIQIGIENPLLTYDTNYMGTVTLLEACKKFDCRRFVFSSTSSAYGRKNTLPLTEDQQTDCLTPYSLSKISAEGACRHYNKMFNMETVILRYFNVYGDRQPVKGPYAPIIGLFKRQRDADEDMTIVGDGRQTRDFTNVSDVVRANVSTLCDQYDRDVFGEVYNIGTGTSVSILDVARMVAPCGKVKHIDPRPGEANHTRANVSKARDMLGWEPTVKLKEWIIENYF